MAASPNDSTPEERAEWRDAAVTFVPAIVLAFVLNWVFEANLGWTSRRSLLTSISIGIGLAFSVLLIVLPLAFVDDTFS